MKKKLKYILIFLLFILFFLLLLYILYRLNIEINSKKIVDKINNITTFDNNQNNSANLFQQTAYDNDVENNNVKNNNDKFNNSNNEFSNDITNNEKYEYFGYNAIGAINIPKINISYPILDELNSQTMRIGVVKIYGPELNESGINVLASHNYMDGSLFSNLSKLSIGDSIYISSINGTKIEYIIYNIFVTSTNDTSYYNLDTGGQKQIALSTCTNDLKNELVVVAKEK